MAHLDMSMVVAPSPSTPGVSVENCSRRITTGPTAAEWEHHKALICELYKSNKVDDVRRLMAERFGFRASNRMYEIRFKKWEVRKSLRRRDKNEIIRQIKESAPDLAKIRESDLRKVLRDLVAGIYAGQSLQSPHSPTSHTSTSSPDSIEARRYSTERPCSDEDDLVFPDFDSWSLLEPGGQETTLSLSDDAPGDGIRLTPSNIASSPDEGLLVPQVLWPGANSSYATPWIRQYVAPSYPSRPLNTNPKSLNAYRVFQEISNYHRHYGARNMIEDDSIDLFWGNVKQGMYLFKVKSPNSASYALNSACTTLDFSLASLSLSFIQEMFTTLSPINSRVCPEARVNVLRVIGTKAQQTLGSRHPLAIICRELQRDAGCPQLSGQALTCIKDLLVLSSSSSTTGSFNHLMLARLKRAEIALLRRDKQYDMAKWKAERLIESSMADIGSVSPLDQHQELHNARTELAHVHMDTQEYVSALKLLETILDALRGYTETGGEVWTNSSQAIYTMEDIAKSHQQLEHGQESIMWLEKAATLAQQFWASNDVRYQHIIEKLEPLLWTAGRGDEVNAWRRGSFLEA